MAEKNPRRNETIDALFDAILSLETREECYDFFEDLCTVKEISDMAQRLEAAKLLLDGSNLDEDEIHDYIMEHFAGDCLLVVGDEETIKLHFHTNQPWQVLEYMASLGDIYDVVIENMERQARGERG